MPGRSISCRWRRWPILPAARDLEAGDDQRIVDDVDDHALPRDARRSSPRLGGGWILSEVHCRRCEGGYFDHELKLWSRSGKLLATSEQVAAFRD